VCGIIGCQCSRFGGVTKFLEKRCPSDDKMEMELYFEAERGGTVGLHGQGRYFAVSGRYRQISMDDEIHK
jgi:hypothetical protein